MEQEFFTELRKTPNDRDLSIPEKIEYKAEDSEFASSTITDSITESSTASVNDSEKSVVVDTKPAAVGLSFLAKRNEEKRRKLDEEREKKRLVEEEYNRELSERRYKRLMHLLDKSQFYANLILKKNDDSTKSSASTSAKSPKKKSPAKKNKASTKKVATKRKIVVIPKENALPSKRPRRNVRLREEHDLKDYVTNSITRKLRDRRNLKKLPVQDEEDDCLQSDQEDEAQDMTVNSSTSLEVINFTPPKYFVGELRDYQIEGLKWLKVLHENGLNGILADEMGLGKTIQVIALLCDLVEKRQNGPFLIIAPLSTIPNWLLEFERFAPELPVVLFHGPPEERLAAHRKIKQKYLVENGNKMYPIVITTYEVPFWEKHFLQSQKWRYIVIDEGHRIKNHQCQLVKVLKTLKSMNRLLLTGTPLQNNLAELWSLLNFLLPEIFNDLAVFESWFDVRELQHEKGTMKFLQQEAEKRVVGSLREILKPFMLRRVKTDVCLEIPPKKEIIVYAPLTELQRDLYKAVLNRDLQTLCKIEDTPVIIDVNGVRPKRQCVLRKNCDLLYSSALQNVDKCFNSTASVANNDSVDWKLDEFEEKILDSSKSASDVNTVDVWTDFSNRGQVLKDESTFNCVKPSSTLSLSANFEQRVQKLISDIQNPAPSCSSINDEMMNLERVDEFGSKNSLVCYMKKIIINDDTDENKKNPENKLSTSCFNLAEQQSLLCNEKINCKSLSPGNVTSSCKVIEKQVKDTKKYKPDSKILSLSINANRAKFSKKGKKVAGIKENKKKNNKKVSSLSNLKNVKDQEFWKDSFANDEEYSDEKDTNADPSDGHPQDLTMWKQYTNVNERNREFLIHITFSSRLSMYKKIVNHPYLMHCPLSSVGLPMIDEDLIKASGKLMVLDQMLAKLNEGGHKVLLFSTWTKILDILEDYLSMRSYLYVRLDGSTKIEKRKENISIFNSDPNVFIFLISTRAGGVGLNLASADTVIIYDSDWNPQVDIQAMARCHRIGQTKPVMVYRFCTKGTIDEEIMKRADVKRKLEKMVISKKDIGPNLNNKETLLKLKQLLESNDSQVASSEKDVFTEEELEKLLDRSDLIQEHQPELSEAKNVLCTSKLENSQGS